MRGCEQQASGVVELYFYDELEPPARTSVERHLARCAECRQTLDDLSMIRTALSSRPHVDAPRDGDWGGFMSRLDRAIARETSEPPTVRPSEFPDSRTSELPDSRTSHLRALRFGRQADRPASRVLHYASYFATAALFALVTSGIVFVGRHAARGDQPASPPLQQAAGGISQTPRPELSPASGFAALSEQHFERSKLVVLGLASKDAKVVSDEDWAYERDLASNLLDDTRLYRMAAEERGLATLAGIMGDLELVLLQTSLVDSADAATLGRIQRLIEQRDLVTKMDVTVTGS